MEEVTMGKFNKNKSNYKAPIEQPVETEVKEEQITTPDFVDPEELEVEAEVEGVDVSLNIRMIPKVEPNNQVGILGKGTKLIVVNPSKTEKNDGEEWYKVKLADGTPGYAMKKYIRVI